MFQYSVTLWFHNKEEPLHQLKKLSSAQNTASNIFLQNCDIIYIKTKREISFSYTGSWDQRYICYFTKHHLKLQKYLPGSKLPSSSIKKDAFISWTLWVGDPTSLANCTVGLCCIFSNSSPNKIIPQDICNKYF